MMHFYAWDAALNCAPSFPPPQGLTTQIWRPHAWSVHPEGLPVFPYAVWTGFHHLGLFSNREYGVVVLREGAQVVHSSLVTPRYARFPVMGSKDLQIGATYTVPAWRGRGLARAAIGLVCRAWAGRFERLWYIVGEENAASIRVVEACGFRLAGTGARVRRFGLSILAQYRILP